MSRFRLKPARLPVRENHVEKACLDLLRFTGWWPIRQHVGRFRAPDGSWITIGEAGDPDYAVLRAPGFFLETKAPDGVLAEIQKDRIMKLERFYKLETAVVTDVGELERWLKSRRSP
jgi:hypothetical protein